MPIDYSKYPDNWEEIRAQILERGENKCEKCGVSNHARIIRSKKDKLQYIIYNPDGYYMYVYPDGTPIKPSEFPSEFSGKEIRIILTIAHLDHDIRNNDNNNLMALCQRCHLMHDAKDNARKAARTRRKRHEKETGQIPMFPEL